MSTNNRILRIYKSRATILKLLQKQGYNVTDYSEFSINEIDTMFTNKQLDMLVTNENTDNKTYVKYYLDAKQVRPQYLDEIIEDLFLVESVLTKNDTLVIIIDGEKMGLTNIKKVDETTPIIIENLIVSIIAEGSNYSLMERRIIGED